MAIGRDPRIGKPVPVHAHQAHHEWLRPDQRTTITADELHKLLAAQTIDGETPIWRKGLADWQPLRTTDVDTQLKDTPPPIAPSHLNNGFVWTLAVAPIAYLFVDIAISPISFSSWTAIPSTIHRFWLY